jgi:hypothetical protein
VPGEGLVELSGLRELITAKPMRGWGEDPKKVEAVIKDDIEVLALYTKATTVSAGSNQHDEVHDNIMHLKAPRKSRPCGRRRPARPTPSACQSTLQTSAKLPLADYLCGLRLPNALQPQRQLHPLEGLPAIIARP